MARFATSVLFTPTLGGTTDWTISAAVVGYNTMALAGMVNGQTYLYRAESNDLTQWEIGEGVYNSGTGVLTRATVWFNSSGTGAATGQSGAGTKISFTVAPVVGIVETAEYIVPRNAGATIQTNLTGPTGTNSATEKMMGLGSVAKITPIFCSRVRLNFYGNLDSSGGFTSNARVYYGTGTAPINGAAVTGTQVGDRASISGSGTTNLSSMFSNGGIITGLTPGTAYWFDLSLSSSGAGNTAVASILSFSAFEF